MKVLEVDTAQLSVAEKVEAQSRLGCINEQLKLAEKRRPP